MLRWFTKQTVEILSEIKSGEIMAVIATVYAVSFSALAVYVGLRFGAFWGFIVLPLSIIPILMLTIVTKFVLSYITKELKWLSGDSEEKQNTEIGKTIRKPQKEELIYKMKSDLIRFRETLRPMKNLISEEQKGTLTFARNILNGLLNDKLPMAETVLGRSKQLREKITGLDVKYQEYCMTYNTIGTGLFNDLYLKQQLWGTPSDIGSLENDTFMLVDELLDLLSREQGNENILSEHEERYLEVVEKFSICLKQVKEERKKKYGWAITGVGLGFLERIKTAPPFLGLEYKNRIISKAHERELTEYFNAAIYMEKYRDSIRGGRPCTVKRGDDRRKIAKMIYGKENYDYYVGRETEKIKTGMILALPYINLDFPHDHDYIKKQVELYRDVNRVASMLQTTYNLVEDEAIWLLRLVFDAAQKVLNG